VSKAAAATEEEERLSEEIESSIRFEQMSQISKGCCEEYTRNSSGLESRGNYVRVDMEEPETKKTTNFGHLSLSGMTP